MFWYRLILCSYCCSSVCSFLLMHILLFLFDAFVCCCLWHSVCYEHSTIHTTLSVLCVSAYHCFVPLSMEVESYSVYFNQPIIEIFSEVMSIMCVWYQLLFCVAQWHYWQYSVESCWQYMADTSICERSSGCWYSHQYLKLWLDTWWNVIYYSILLLIFCSLSLLQILIFHCYVTPDPVVCSFWATILWWLEMEWCLFWWCVLMPLLCILEEEFRCISYYAVPFSWSILCIHCSHSVWRWVWRINGINDKYSVSNQCIVYYCQ